jgi:hypothetical protein
VFEELLTVLTVVSCVGGPEEVGPPVVFRALLFVINSCVLDFVVQ